MSFQALGFALFFPAVSALYFLLPAGRDNRIRNLELLAAGYFFYAFGNPEYLIFLLYVTIITFLSGLYYAKHKDSSLPVFIPVILALIPLMVFKYTGFFLRNLNLVLSRTLGFQAFIPELLLPVGIYFYTFAALSYVLDVRKGKIPAEKDPLDYALFVSFFPAILSGPIERGGHLIPQIKEKHGFDPERIKNGALLMLWGYFLKLVLSCRIALFVDSVYGDYAAFTGVYSILAILLYSLQIYIDFESYSCIACGCGEVLGFKLFRNFERPYLAQSMADFWRRWHISLTSFFRDYVYIPLGGNRKGVTRKHLNVLIVFALSGLWHGASWNFVFWGVLNGVFQVMGEILSPLRQDFCRVFGIRKDSFGTRFFKTVSVFIMASAAWTFFRAESFMSALKILRNCFIFNPWVIFDGSLLKLGLTRTDLLIVFISLLIFFVKSLLNERGLNIRKKLDDQDLWFRWGVYITAVLTVLIFGMYGPMYDPSEFIYFKF